jgi:hypothetical protein
MRTLTNLAISLVAIAAVTCGSSVAKARPGQTPVASASANVPQSEIQEGLESLQATTVNDPGVTPILFKPISTRALKLLRPFLKRDSSLITDKGLADAWQNAPTPTRVFVAQLRDEGAGHDLLFVMGVMSSQVCTPSARRLGSDSCIIEGIVDEGWIHPRAPKGIVGPLGFFVYTEGGPVLLLKAGGSMSVLYCQGVNPTEVWQAPFTYSGDPAKNADGSYRGNSRLSNVNRNGPMRC